MNQNELQKLRDAIERRYADRVRLAEEERNKDLDALRRIEELQSGLGGLLSSSDTKAVPHVSSGGSIRRLNNEGIRKIIRSFDTDFSIADVRSVAEKDGFELSRASFHTVIKVMIKRKELTEIKKGEGKRGSIFRLAASCNQLQGEVDNPETKSEPIA